MGTSEKEKKVILKVGKKGLFLPKKLLKKIGASNGDSISVKVNNRKLVIELSQKVKTNSNNKKKRQKSIIDDLEKISEEEQEYFNL